MLDGGLGDVYLYHSEFVSSLSPRSSAYGGGLFLFSLLANFLSFALFSPPMQIAPRRCRGEIANSCNRIFPFPPCF